YPSQKVCSWSCLEVRSFRSFLPGLPVRCYVPSDVGSSRESGVTGSAGGDPAMPCRRYENPHALREGRGECLPVFVPPTPPGDQTVRVPSARVGSPRDSLDRVGAIRATSLVR